MIRSSIRRRVFALLFAIPMIVIASCAPIYFPPPASVPLFTNAGEIQVAGATSTSGSGGEIAFSPARHFGVTASGYYGSEKTEDGIKSNWSYDAGLAYYFTETFPFRVEFLAGMGAGGATTYQPIFHYDRSSDSTIRSAARLDAAYRRWLLQCNAAVVSHPHPFSIPIDLDAGMALRLSRLDITSFRQNGISLDVPASNFLEIASFIRGGSDNFQLELQMETAMLFGDTKSFDWAPFTTSLGFRIFLWKTRE